jgi:hypothetical protein
MKGIDMETLRERLGPGGTLSGDGILFRRGLFWSILSDFVRSK